MEVDEIPDAPPLVRVRFHVLHEFLRTHNIWRHMQSTYKHHLDIETEVEMDTDQGDDIQDIHITITRCAQMYDYLASL